MDKLKPILAHKFWILFGLVLILPVVGYYMTKGGMAATIDARRTALDGKLGSIPSGTDSPNEQWIEGLKNLNAQQALRNRQANKQLWEAQLERMRWPDDIAATMKTTAYFQPPASVDKASDVQHKYVYDYPDEARRLWQIVDPLDDGKNQRDSDAKRKVIFAMSDLHLMDSSRWADLAPNLSEVWAAQEDVWLQTELLSAVKRINANAPNLADSFIKQIGRIQLFGGTKAGGDASAATAGGGGGGAPGVEGGAPGMLSGGGPFGAGGGFGDSAGGFGGSRSGTGTGSAEIPLSEEFTINQESTVGGGGGLGEAGFGGSAVPGAVGGPGTAVDVNASAAPTEGGTATGAAPTVGPVMDPRRYVDFTEGLPYKKRGFYIRVVMDHRKVPEFIAELMNSPFPVEIVRIHQTVYTESSTGSGGGAGMTNPLFGGGGAGTGALAGVPGGGPVGAPGLPVGGPGGASRGAAGVGALAGDEGGAPIPGVLGGGRGSAGFGTEGAGAPGTGTTPGQSAMSDPNLASVAIVGLWTLYIPPPAAPEGVQAGSDGAAVNPATTQPAPAASPDLAPNATPETPVAPAGNPAEGTPATPAANPSANPTTENKAPDPNAASNP